MKPQVCLWFTPSATVAQKCHLFWLYQSDSLDDKRRLFVFACNNCKRVMKVLFSGRMKPLTLDEMTKENH